MQDAEFYNRVKFNLGETNKTRDIPVQGLNLSLFQITRRWRMLSRFTLIQVKGSKRNTFEKQSLLIYYSH